MRRMLVLTIAPVLALAVAAPAWACGGLIGPNGTVSLGRTTTLAGRSSSFSKKCVMVSRMASVAEQRLRLLDPWA